VEEKAKPPPVKQYVPPASAYGQPYRPGPQQAYGGQQNQYYQNRTLPPIQQPSPHVHSPATGRSPAPSATQSPQPPAVSRAQQPTASSSPQPAQADKKASSDPVITMLATRASSDPELKGLMKEVATGNASAAQLKIFQNHIDELTKVIAEKKKKDEEDEAAAQAAKEREQQSDMIQYDGSNDTPQAQTTFQRPGQPYQQAPYQAQQPTWQAPTRPTPPAPTTQPVILAFTTPGATEDRFLFPQNAILESLSPQHLLASFIITRRGSQAADSTGLDPETEYWQSITLMVEVAYNREHLIECVKKWVKPADEVRKWMEETMKRCTRAPESHLALRLPIKGSKEAAEPEEVLGESGEESVAAVLATAGQKKKPNIKYVKKAPKKEDAGGAKKGGIDGATTATSGASAAPTAVGGQVDGAAGEVGEGKVGEQETTETGRPRRAVRKSVRISEG